MCYREGPLPGRVSPQTEGARQGCTEPQGSSGGAPHDC